MNYPVILPDDRINHYLALTVEESWPRFEKGTLPLCEVMALEHALRHLGAVELLDQVRQRRETLQLDAPLAEHLHLEAMARDEQDAEVAWEGDEELQRELQEEFDSDDHEVELGSDDD